MILPATSRDAPILDLRPEAKKRCYAVMTYATAEWQAWQALRDKGIECWYPHYVASVADKRWRQGKVRPHLPGYVFVWLSPWDSVRAVKAAPGVWEIVSWRNVPQAVPDFVMAELRARLEPLIDRACDAVVAAAIVPGRKHKVLDGPFADFVATVESVVSKERIKVWLDIFGRPTDTELAAASLGPEIADRSAKLA